MFWHKTSHNLITCIQAVWYLITVPSLKKIFPDIPKKSLQTHTDIAHFKIAIRWEPMENDNISIFHLYDHVILQI